MDRVCEASKIASAILAGSLWSCVGNLEADASRTPSFLPRPIPTSARFRLGLDAGTDVGSDATVDVTTPDVIGSDTPISETFAVDVSDTAIDASDTAVDASDTAVDAPDTAVDAPDTAVDAPDTAIDTPIVAMDVPVAVDVPITPIDVPIVVDTYVPPTDTYIPPVDTYVPPTDSGPGTDAVPAFDTATDAHVRSIVALGLARGNNHAIVAKIGDSITESQSFLFDCGFGWYDVGAYPELEPTITYFRMVPIGTTNSLNRSSLCAVGGWACSDALAGSPNSALAQELDAIHPLWAIVMYGTNDMQRYDLGTFVTNLGTIMDIIEARAVVPVMSTIPSRSDTEPYISMVPSFNDAIRSMASSRHLPLIDLNVALAPLPALGLSPDGIHPNAYINPADSSADTCVLTSAGLQFGYNMRNLTALQMLTRLRGY